MKTLPKLILTIVLILAVMGYTVYNYTVGKTELTFFIVAMAILCFPLVNLINLLIKELKKK